MLAITDLSIARDVGVALLLSFTFWILVGYGLLRFVRFGVCSVCGAVVTVWAANLFLGFLPGWVTLLLLGQSVVGGSALARDLLFSERIAAADPAGRRVLGARAQMAWFAFILAGTFALGLLGLLWGLDRPVGVTLAAVQLALLLATLVVAYMGSILVFYATQRLWGLSFCQVCVAVSSVWVANLAFGFLPAWATVFLMGQSVAGAAAMLRDAATTRMPLHGMSEGRRRVTKQATYFAFLVAGTLAATVLAVAALPVGSL